jgi:molybdopterin synthase sulfur carrier subunit
VRITVRIPSALRRFSDERSTVLLELPGSDGVTLASVLEALRAIHPGVCDRTLDERGVVRQHVNVFIDGESIRNTGGLSTRVSDGAEIAIIPAVSGGLR